MPGILFTNAWMLTGLAALSIPVLIHLLLKRKKKRMRFSTVQFFVRQDEQASQRRKLRNWLLLALRLLICALLVLAFARPFFEDPAAGATRQQRQVILLLDRSLSMQAVSTNTSKWDRAKASAQEVLSTLRPDDRAALVGCGPSAEVLCEWAPAAAVTKKLKELSPTCGAAKLTDGLQQAKQLLTFADPKAATTLYLISDLQRNGAQNLASCPMPSEVEVKTLPIGDLVTPNLALVDLQLEWKDGVTPHAAVSSFSDEDNSSVKMDLTVDGKVISSGAFALAAGASTNIDLAVPSLKPGWHDVAVRIQGHDALLMDDARFQTVFVPQPTQAWVVETRPSERRFEEESFFVTTALNPAQDATNAVQSRFEFEKLSLEELSRRLNAPRSPLACDLVILPGLRQVPAGLGRTLQTYLRAGGGLLLFVGDGVSANRYNAEFKGLIPGQLGSIESKGDLESGWRIGAYDTNTALFASFQIPNSGNPALARFMNRFQLSPENASAILARFSDGMPFLLGAQVGAGRLLLVNTSMDATWNDWPKHKSFVPWLHGAGHHLAKLTSRERIQTQTTWTASADADLELGAAAAKRTYKLVSPTKRETILIADDQGTMADLNLSEPGVYSIRAESGLEVRRIAVNVPPSESDLGAWSLNEVQQQVARLPESRPTTLAAGLLGTGNHEREFGRILLLAALVLLFTELVVANRTLA